MRGPARWVPGRARAGHTPAAAPRPGSRPACGDQGWVSETAPSQAEFRASASEPKSYAAPSALAPLRPAALARAFISLFIFWFVVR